MIGRIIAVSETKYIKIVADATHCPTNQDKFKWDYKAVAYDPIKQESSGQAFNVTKAEIEQWMK